LALESFAGFIGSILWVAGAAGGLARPVYREVADLDTERAVERVTCTVTWVRRTGDEELALESFAGFIDSTLWMAGAADGPARPVYREVADLDTERAVERVTCTVT
jgi:hypothetical protein